MSASTTAYPYSSIVYITDYIGGVEYQASGVLIAPDEVLTATHVVYSTGVGTATDIEVLAGYENGATPYGTVAGVSYHYNTLNDSNDQITNAASQSDFAVIHLAQPITSAGTMTLGDNFSGGAVTISGYPASSGGQQVDSAETVTVDRPYTLFQGKPLGAGSSGGPVWVAGANGADEVVGLVSSGTSRTGYFVQLTAADVAEIEAWVTSDDGTTSPSNGLVAETVTGAAGAIITLYYPAATASLAATLLGQISADIAAGSLVAELAGPSAAPPTLQTVASGELVISQAEAVTVPAQYAAIVDNAAGASTVSLASGTNVSVAASGGGLDLVAGSSSGTLVGGSGAVLFIGGSDAGAWDIDLAGGANTIEAAGSGSTIAAGSGQNLIYLGRGADSVASTGSDTIIGAGSGAVTVSAAANQALVFGVGTALTFIAGSGISTVVGGAGGSTLQGGTGATLFFGIGNSAYVGDGAADTVVGGGGTLNAQGNGGAVVLFGGSAGGNRLSNGGGAASMVGGGNGDILTATGRGNVLMAAAGGNETLNAASSSGSDVMWAGSGADCLEGGSGNDILIAGIGNDTLAGGSGATDFVFLADDVGASEVVSGFNAQRDELVLAGFGGRSPTSAIGSETVTGAGLQITLVNGSHVTFLGLSQLNSAVIV